ncbi:MAG: GFA family protein [Pseudomonadota bacterium]
MMVIQDGGCICGAVRFRTEGDAARITICHCRFCQKATGSAYMVEPLFLKMHHDTVHGTPSVHTVISAGSGKAVHLHFCQDCGGKLWLSFERFDDTIGIYAGGYDDPSWIDASEAPLKHIFLDSALPGTVIPSGVPTFRQHAMLNDGAPVDPVIYEQPHVIAGTA